jgi:type IV pilus assembly protein PilW
VRTPLEKGFSLIEFMIAITIAMIILLAVSIAWQSGLATQNTQTDASRLNETVRYAIDLLSREIKQAGLINTTNLSNGITPELNFCSTTSVGGAIAGANDPTTINPTISGATISTGAGVSVSNLSDVIRIRYYGDDPNAGGAALGTEPTYDCQGNTVPAGQLVEDTLFVQPLDPANPTTTEPALWCYTSNTNAATKSVPIVVGVESLQILYGEDMPDPTSGLYDGIINHYVPWQLLNNGINQNSDNVLSVKVSIVARGANPVIVGTAAVSKTYQHFGTSYSDPGGTTGTTFTNTADKRLRLPHPLSTEIAVRNFSHC